MAADVSKIKDGEKIPGTYCPLCGEIGLRKLTKGKTVWAWCPMNATGLDDCHTGYEIDSKPAPVPAPKPKPVLKETPHSGDIDEEENDG